MKNTYEMTRKRPTNKPTERAAVVVGKTEKTLLLRHPFMYEIDNLQTSRRMEISRL